MEYGDSVPANLHDKTSGNPETKIPKRIGFQTPSSGTIWFEFSASKAKGYFLEMATYKLRKTMFSDISFSTVLEMSLLKLEELDEPPAFGSDLCAILDDAVKDEVRQNMLNRVCKCIMAHSDQELLLQKVEESFEADLKKANISWPAVANVIIKACLVSHYSISTLLKRQHRQEKDEFRIHLSMIIKGQPDNLSVMTLHISYGSTFAFLLSLLQDMTVLQTPKGGFTLEDGPWIYSIEHEGRVGEYCHLTDNNSFRDMVHQIKRSEGATMIIHSTERSMIQQYYKDKEEEEESRDSIDDVLDDDGGKFFCDSTYLEYLATQP